MSPLAGCIKVSTPEINQGGEWILPAEYYYKSFVLTLPEPA